MSSYKGIRTKDFISKSSHSLEQVFFKKWTRHQSDSLKLEIARTMNETINNVSFDSYLSLNSPSLDSLESYISQSQLHALFKKDQDMLSPIDKKAVALKSFLEAEDTCKLVNERFRSRSFCENAKDSQDVEMVLYHAQRKISSIIGDVPLIEDLDLSFGPGASTSCRKITSARWKLSRIPSISNSLLRSHLISDVRRTLPHLSSVVWRVDDSVIEFVPKSYKTDRSICIEPSINGMFQRALGNILKQRMKWAGIDLYDQSINRRRARMGSTFNSYVTIDLEKASDSISYGLVLDLLPITWFEYLDSFRSEYCRLPDGSVIPQEKFSSMGNGYTFELESLIFYSLAYGISVHHGVPFDLTVYGDDIVTTSELYHLILRYFPIFGFTVNKEKSFESGPFRESCGFDAFLGVDVRPYFWKDRASLSLCYSFYNFLISKPWFDPNNKIKDILLKYIPSHLRLFGPADFGDGHLHDPNFDQFKPYKRRRGFAGYTFNTITAKPKRIHKPLPGDVLLPSYLISQRGDASFLRRHWWSEISTPSDPFVVRTSKLIGRKTNIYVLAKPY